MKRKKIYVAGNPLVKTDSVPLKIMSKLQRAFPGMEFIELEPTDNLPDEKSLNIIDTVIGIDSVKVIDDIDAIVTGKVYSLHDFDLGFNLKLMKKTGKLNRVNIIGVPAHFSEAEAMKGVARQLKKL